MGELLACFQGLHHPDLVPEWYGSWEELRVDIVNNIYVPDFVINEDDGTSVTMNPHYMVPRREFLNGYLIPEGALALVGIPDFASTGQVYLPDEVPGHAQRSRINAMTRDAYSTAQEENLNEIGRDSGRVRRTRTPGRLYQKSRRWIVAKIGDPICYLCDVHIGAGDPSIELDHRGMRHLRNQEGRCML